MNRLQSLHQPLLAALTVSLATSFGCGSGNDGDTRIDDAFPADLAVASPTTVSPGNSPQAFSRIARAIGLNPSRPSELVSLNGQDYATLTTSLATMLSPTTEADCAFSFDITPQFQNATCYGPNIDYTNHPDGSDGDPLPGGDVGLWDEEDEAGTACAVAQMNSRMNGIARLANGAVFLGASAYCSASLDADTGLPADGETQDITSVMDSTLSSGGMDITVTEASLSRDGDTYVAEVNGTTENDDPIFVRVAHENGSSGDYIGKISLTVEQSDYPALNCPAGSVTHAVSIAYELSDQTMTYEVNSGTFCGAGADPFVSSTNFTVDASNTYDSSSNPNGWGDNFSRARVSFDRDSYAGSYGFTWQAGKGDSHSRTLLMSITDLDASTAGTAYFGFGPKLEDSDGAEIEGMICNWAGPGNSHSPLPLVQKQTFAGVSFGAVSSSITYAPVNACSSTSTTFSYHAVTGNPSSPTDVDPDMTNDHSTAGLAVTHDLETYVAADMPNPTGPTDIDE